LIYTGRTCEKVLICGAKSWAHIFTVHLSHPLHLCYSTCFLTLRKELICYMLAQVTWKCGDETLLWTQIMCKFNPSLHTFIAWQMLPLSSMYLYAFMAWVNCVDPDQPANPWYLIRIKTVGLFLIHVSRHICAVRSRICTVCSLVRNNLINQKAKFADPD
jgi:hypothetical protein